LFVDVFAEFLESSLPMPRAALRRIQVFYSLMLQANRRAPPRDLLLRLCSGPIVVNVPL